MDDKGGADTEAGRFLDVGVAAHCRHGQEKRCGLKEGERGRM